MMKVSNDVDCERDKLNKTIVILFLVSIMMAAFAATSGNLAKASTSDVKILSYSWYIYPDTPTYPGDFIVVGEVQNVGSTTQNQVRIEGIPYTTDGQPQAYVLVGALVDNLVPGQKAPFYMDFYVDNSYSGNMTWDTMVDHVALSIVSSNDTTTQPYSGLALVTNTSYTDPSSGVYTVLGIINNTGNEDAGRVFVETTFYNATGTVIAINYTDYLTNSFFPGQTVPFTATPQDYSRLTGQIASYSIFVLSRPATPNPTSTPPSPTPTTSQSPNQSPTASPTNVASASPQPTQSSTPKSSSPELIYAAIFAAVIVIIVAAAIIFRKR